MLTVTSLLAFAVMLYVAALVWITRHWTHSKEFVFTAGEKYVPISVVISLRNEAGNIPKLIACLKNQSHSNFEVILINDHSTDETQLLLDKLTDSDRRFRVINAQGKGKKSALREAVDKSLNETIITTDADCKMGKDWVAAIAAFHQRFAPAMVIAPVTMRSRSKYTHLFELEFIALQMVTAGMALGQQPVMCNGANLSFKKTDYQHANLKNDYASGDDMFLLAQMLESKKRVGYIKHKEAVVETPAPENFTAYLKQRSRWLRKATGYTRLLPILTAIVVLLANISWIVLAILAVISSELTPAFVAIVLLTAKYMADYQLLKAGSDFFGTPVKRGKAMILELSYPFIIMLIVAATVGRDKRKW